MISNEILHDLKARKALAAEQMAAKVRRDKRIARLQLWLDNAPEPSDNQIKRIEEVIGG